MKPNSRCKSFLVHALRLFPLSLSHVTVAHKMATPVKKSVSVLLFAMCESVLVFSQSSRANLKVITHWTTALGDYTHSRQQDAFVKKKVQELITSQNGKNYHLLSHCIHMHQCVTKSARIKHL